MKIDKITEAFVFFPTFIIDWMETNKKRVYNLSFSWLFWQIRIVDNLSKYLDSRHCY